MAKPKQRPRLDLDGLYSPEEFAPWIGVSKRTLLQLAGEGKIPALRLNGRVLRFNPRTVLQRMK